MERFISPENSFEIEQAIQFLVTEYTRSGKNSKPVILHSLRVGLYLLELGYEKDIVIAGILHDLLEDTDVTKNEIERSFGIDVAGWVLATSLKPDIADPVEQHEEMYTRIHAAGRPAVAIKAADLHANSLYISLAQNRDKKTMLLNKIASFLDMAQEYHDEPVVRNLQQRYQEERKLSN